MSAWPDKLRTRPITTWPGERTPPDARKSTFRATLSDTLDLLDRELYMLNAADIWLELAIPAGGMWRQDGRPRAGARADHPGVVLAFTARAIPGRPELRYASDRFTTWQENLRAIALGLEALRKLERYGITTRGQQYAGWKQLEAPGPSAARGRELIRRHGSVRAALHATHPDHGGDAADFADVQAAREEGAT